MHVVMNRRIFYFRHTTNYYQEEKQVRINENIVFVLVLFILVLATQKIIELHGFFRFPFVAFISTVANSALYIRQIKNFPERGL